MSFENFSLEVRDRVAYLNLNRPKHGNALTFDLIGELPLAVQAANDDPSVHVIVLGGHGKGFCGGYDLAAYAETAIQNHNPKEPWDPVLDYRMMSRNVRCFMSLWESPKPVICKVHRFCVAGGTDLALCSDLLVIDEDAKIGYPPARVWGCPTTSVWVYRLGLEKAKRLLFTGDCLTGKQAVEWGLAIQSAPLAELDEVTEALATRVAQVPINQLVMMKMLLNQSAEQMGLRGAQVLGTLFDGVARHTPEGYAWAELAQTRGFKEAVRVRDEPFGDYGVAGKESDTER